MQPHQQRVVDEAYELEKKLRKLDSFIGTELYNALSDMEQRLLSMQFSTMQAYHAILKARISLF